MMVLFRLFRGISGVFVKVLDFIFGEFRMIEDIVKKEKEYDKLRKRNLEDRKRQIRLNDEIT